MKLTSGLLLTYHNSFWINYYSCGIYNYRVLEGICLFVCVCVCLYVSQKRTEFQNIIGSRNKHACSYIVQNSLSENQITATVFIRSGGVYISVLDDLGT